MDSTLLLEKKIGKEQKELCSLLKEVDSLFQEESFSQKVSYAVRLCLEEMIMNTISYGCFKKSSCEIRVQLSKNEKEIVVDILDNADPFDPLKKSEEHRIQDAPGGHGIFLVRQMMDSLEYQWKENQNHFIAKKHL